MANLTQTKLNSSLFAQRPSAELDLARTQPGQKAFSPARSDALAAKTPAAPKKSFADELKAESQPSEKPATTPKKEKAPTAENSAMQAARPNKPRPDAASETKAPEVKQATKPQSQSQTAGTAQTATGPGETTPEAGSEVKTEEAKTTDKPRSRSMSPVVAFLAGQLDQVDPSSITQMVSDNPFIKDALSEEDTWQFLNTPKPTADLLNQLSLSTTEKLRVTKSGNAPEVMSASEIFKGLGIDPQRVSAEIELLRTNVRLDGLSGYVARALRMGKQAGLADGSPLSQIPMENPKMRNLTQPDDQPAMRTAELSGRFVSSGETAPTTESPKTREGAGPQGSPRTPDKGSISQPRAMTLAAPVQGEFPFDPADAPKAASVSNASFLGMESVGFSDAKKLNLSADVPEVADLGFKLKSLNISTEHNKPAKAAEKISAEPNMTDASILAALPLQPMANEHLSKFVSASDAGPAKPIDLMAAQIQPQKDGEFLSLDTKSADLTKPSLNMEAQALAYQGETVGQTHQNQMVGDKLNEQLLRKMILERSAKPETLESKDDMASSAAELDVETIKPNSAGDKLGNDSEFGLNRGSSAIVSSAADNSTGSQAHSQNNGGDARDQSLALRERIMEKAQSVLREGGGHMQFELGNEQSGKLEVAMDVRKNDVSLTILAASDGMKDMLMQDTGRLRESLQNQNLNLKQFDVGLMQMGGGSMSSFSQQQDRSAAQTDSFDKSNRPVRSISNSIALTGAASQRFRAMNQAMNLGRAILGTSAQHRVEVLV